MSNDIEIRLKTMIVERLFMRITPDELETDSSLVDDYDVDSVSLLELVVGLEEEFGIVVADDDFSVQNFESVAKLAQFVRSKSESA
jgi:acyl carrier protein